MESVGKFGNPQSPWRWDDTINSLVHDRDITVEKTDLKGETASEKIDLWNLPPSKRPPAYEKYPVEVSKDKKIVTMKEIIQFALNMVSDTYYVPERFADFVTRPELEDFFLHLINYFHWFFEYQESQIRTNELCVEFDYEERQRISNAEAHMNTGLLFVAQKYSNIVLGTGLKQFHHFYWIEGEDGDPLTKRREIIPYSGRVSRTLIDRGYAELLIIFSTFVVWITFERQKFEIIGTEIGRIIRTDSFPNPTYSTTQVRTRSGRKTANDLSNGLNDDNSPLTAAERKRTAASRKSGRTQRTVATASTDRTVSSGKSVDGSRHSQTSVQRLLTQRSPVVVTLLPTARDQSAWLFSRRHSKDEQSSNKINMIPEHRFHIRHEVGILGQPIDALIMNVGAEASSTNTTVSQMSHADIPRRSVDLTATH